MLETVCSVVDLRAYHAIQKRITRNLPSNLADILALF